MLLCPDAIRSQENQGGGHGDHLEGQLRTLWNGVQRMQSPTGRTKVVGIREQPRSTPSLVLRELRSRARDGCQSASRHHVGKKQEARAVATPQLWVTVLGDNVGPSSQY